MRVAEVTIKALQEIATGDAGLSRYRGGPALVTLFNQFGFNDVYGPGFPSRWAYAEDRIRQLNDTPNLARLIEAVLDPREFLNADQSQEAAADHVNARLRYDGFVVKLVDTMPRVVSLKKTAVEFTPLRTPATAKDPQFVDEQLAKCD